MWLSTWLKKRAKNTFITPVRGFDGDLPERRLGHAHQQPISILRFPLERLGQELERHLGERLVLGLKFAKDYGRPPWHERGKCWYPIHYQPELGFPLLYLAKEREDHANGPVVDTASGREATWILCVCPDGIRVMMEVFETSLMPVISRTLEEVSTPTVFEVTLTEIYRKSLCLRASTEWMKHRIVPRIVSEHHRGPPKKIA